MITLLRAINESIDCSYNCQRILHPKLTLRSPRRAIDVPIVGVVIHANLIVCMSTHLVKKALELDMSNQYFPSIDTIGLIRTDQVTQRLDSRRTMVSRVAFYRVVPRVVEL